MDDGAHKPAIKYDEEGKFDDEPDIDITQVSYHVCMTCYMNLTSAAPGAPAARAGAPLASPRPRP